jgi:hypothetical protein
MLKTVHHGEHDDQCRYADGDPNNGNERVGVYSENVRSLSGFEVPFGDEKFERFVLEAFKHFKILTD